MPETTPLDTLIARARQRADDALQAMGHAQRHHDQARQQLDALRQYRHDYQTQLQSAMRHGMDTGRYQNYVMFLDSLDSAIGQQDSLLARLAQQLDGSRRGWADEKRALDAYTTLAQRRRRQAQAQELRREQKVLDEYALRPAAQAPAYSPSMRAGPNALRAEPEPVHP